MKEPFVSHAHAQLSHHPAGACVCWQRVWIHVLFSSSVSPSRHSDRLRRCAVDSQAWTCHQSAPNLIHTQAPTCTQNKNKHTQSYQWSLCNTRYSEYNHRRVHTYTHTVGHSVFIRRAAEGCERTQQLRQITDKLNSSHSPARLTDGRECGKNGDMTDIQNAIITPKVTSSNITIVKSRTDASQAHSQLLGILGHLLSMLGCLKNGPN